MSHQTQKEMNDLYEEIKTTLKKMCDIDHPPKSLVMSVKGEKYQAEVDIIWRKYQKI